MNICIQQILSWALKFLYYISPSLTIVILGGIVVKIFFIKQSNKACFIDRACHLMAELKEVCANYWLVDQGGPTKQDNYICEAKIKGALLQLRGSLKFMKEKYNIKIKEEGDLVIDLLEICTGGDFETTERKSNKERYFKIVASVNRFTDELQKIKI